jgi:UDP-N-acetylglucosamine 4,6-dehydratase
MLNNKSVLVTGGTGSFGKEFVRAVLRDYTPSRLIVFSRDELKQSEMAQEFPYRPGGPLRYFIGDVRDRQRLHQAMQGVDYVIHAAAMKQVPACEYNPFEAILTNVMGTANVIHAALHEGVEKAIFLSSDKAVAPVNLYGATKMCAERLFIKSNVYAGATGTKFSCVRYGNVVGSRGSVIPLFLKQREAGVLTITDERMTRFWMTLGQAVESVLSALYSMEGKEIFVPRLPSMRIVDLAEAIAPKAKHEIVGIRPGEKLHEVLISEDGARDTIGLPKCFVVHPQIDYDLCELLPDNFRYTSDTNTDWLSIEDLQQMIGER